MGKSILGVDIGYNSLKLALVKEIAEEVWG